jgi:hypothetical protein
MCGADFPHQAAHFLVSPAPLEPLARQLPLSGQIKAAAFKLSYVPECTGPGQGHIRQGYAW